MKKTKLFVLLALALVCVLFVCACNGDSGTTNPDQTTDGNTPDNTTAADNTTSADGTTEADVEAGRISNESPIGNALLGRKAGDVVNVSVPAGVITITVKKVY